jgi:YcxB-like protein
VEIQFTLNRIDLVRFNVHHASRRLLTWTIVVILAAMIARTVPTDFPLLVRIFFYVLILLLIAGVMFLATAAIAFVSYAKAKNRGVLGEHKLIITPEAITETTAVNSSTWSWSGVPNVSENGSYIFIYVQQNLAHIVPKRAFGSSAEAHQFYDVARSAWETARRAA